MACIETLVGNKPFLKPGQFRQLVYFNLAYSEDYVLLGVSNTNYLGVDIEKIGYVNDIPSFAADYFSLQEQLHIFEKEKTEEQLILLFTLWVMKEAVIKALGAGFTTPLPNYSLYPFLAHPYYIPDFDMQNTWFIRQIVIDVHYRAAIAIKADWVKLSIFEYEKR